MTSLTIDSAHQQFISVWYGSGNEQLRLDAVTWLKKPSAAIPQSFVDIAKFVCISVRDAISLAKIEDDQNLSNEFDRSSAFRAMPIAALHVVDKTMTLYEKRHKNIDSSGAADSKVLNGQWRGDSYKPGLIVKLDDFFTAHLAYYMVISGVAAVREVRHATGWSVEKIKELFELAVRETHRILSTVGSKTLKFLIKTVNRGMHFFSIFFSTLETKQHAKDIVKMSRAVKVKANIDNTADVGIDAEDDEGNGADDDSVGFPPLDGRTSANNSEPENNDHDDDFDISPGTSSDATHQASGKVIDDPDNHPERPDTEEEDSDPPAQLMMGREMAFFMLAQAKKDATKSKNQRYREILEKIDDKILVNALQKGARTTDKNLRSTDLEIAMRMSSFLSFLWQWSSRTGIFLDDNYRHILNMEHKLVIRQTISAVRQGYWESGDNQPQDTPKVWMDVKRENQEYGQRFEVVALIRTVSIDIKTKPHEINGRRDGRMVILNPDHATFRAYFFSHLKKHPAKESTRYFRTLMVDGTLEKITCQRLVHMRTSPLTNATEIDDVSFNPTHNCDQYDNNNNNNRVWDANDENVKIATHTLHLDGFLFKAAKRGDDKALQIIANAGSQMSEKQQTDLEARICQHEHKQIKHEKGISPECLNDRDITELAQSLNLDKETLRMAFRDDLAATRALKHAFSKLSNLDRSRAICLIHKANNRHRRVA
jgi:hypothetical protein